MIHKIQLFFFFCDLFIWESEKDSEQGEEWLMEGADFPLRESPVETQSQILEIMTWAKPCCLTDWTTQLPWNSTF